jgi:hypothetical protein
MTASALDPALPIFLDRRTISPTEAGLEVCCEIDGNLY